ncbi:rod-determining factor RdfA [Haloarchaeobius baliensis]|uniref:rod-determining factor RdfA n=1 Tax=Haloarchaeobius baliensis TaxID=1670458 RepID=UPI003F8851BD
MTGEGSGSPSNKVDRVVEKYGLDGLADELAARWLGVDGDQASTRELAAFFNRRVLAAAVDGSDAFTLTGSVDELYHGLTDEDGDSTLVRSRLEQHGVDVDAVTGDFVSHQTVYRYLKDHRELEQPETSAEERVENAIETVQRLRGRTTAVAERTVESLAANELVDVGEFSVLNDVQVLCEDCGRSDDVTTFIERGGCRCADED